VVVHLTVKKRIITANLINLVSLILCCCPAVNAEIVECITTQRKINGSVNNVTECQSITTKDDFLTSKFYNSSKTFKEKVGILSSLEEMLGISIGKNRSGANISFGFTEQLIRSDAYELENAYGLIMDSEHSVMSLSEDQQGIPTSTKFK